MPTVFLKDLAFARSGDKGDVSSIGLMAKSRTIYDFFLKTITADRVKEHFGQMVRGDIEVYPLPNLNSLQIILRRALGGGATSTLRFDQTGKSMGQALLRMKLDVEEELIKEAQTMTEDIKKRYSVQNG